MINKKKFKKIISIITGILIPSIAIELQLYFYIDLTVILQTILLMLFFLVVFPILIYLLFFNNHGKRVINHNPRRNRNRSIFKFLKTIHRRRIQDRRSRRK